MFIELTEYLQCPRDHERAWLVLAPERMEGRHVARGVVGCPACHAEYPIVEGVVRFGPAPALPAVANPEPDVVQALIGLESPGGVVLLAGSAGGLAEGLGGLLEGVHLAVVNGPALPIAPQRSLFTSAAGLPFRDHLMRGVVLGPERAAPADLLEARRVLLPGQRVVVLAEAVEPVEGLEPLAQGQGMWVGRRR